MNTNDREPEPPKSVRPLWDGSVHIPLILLAIALLLAWLAHREKLG